MGKRIIDWSNKAYMRLNVDELAYHSKYTGSSKPRPTRKKLLDELRNWDRRVRRLRKQNKEIPGYVLLRVRRIETELSS